MWLTRQWILGCLDHFLNGKVLKPRNLFRDCRKNGIKDPRDMTRDDLGAEVAIFTKDLKLLAKKAPMLRHAHLKSLVKAAEARGDQGRVTAILKILHREAGMKRWQNVNRTTKAPRARSILSVKVPTDEGDEGLKS